MRCTRASIASPVCPQTSKLALTKSETKTPPVCQTQWATSRLAPQFRPRRMRFARFLNLERMSDLPRTQACVHLTSSLGQAGTNNPRCDWRLKKAHYGIPPALSTGPSGFLRRPRYPATTPSRTRDRSGVGVSTTAQEPYTTKQCQTLPAPARQSCFSSSHGHVPELSRRDDRRREAFLEISVRPESAANLRSAAGPAGSIVHASLVPGQIPMAMSMRAMREQACLPDSHFIMGVGTTAQQVRDMGCTSLMTRHE